MAKKTNVADTSSNAYKSLVASGQMSKEIKMVFEAVKVNQPVTGRMLSKITGLEIGNITSPLYVLKNAKNLIEVVFKRECQLSGHVASHYAIIGWEATN